MRSSLNPLLENDDKLDHSAHVIIMPVYIPNLNGYYSDALKILKYSVESILCTKNEATRLIIVNNASTSRIRDYLLQLYLDGQIDKLILNNENRGKIESVLSAARGCWEPLITITDADILFRENWESNVFNAFSAFPKLGVFGMMTSPDAIQRATSTTLIDNLLSMNLRLGKVISDKTITETYKSTGRLNSDGYIKALRQRQPYIKSRQGQVYVMGANHAAATYKRKILFDQLERRVSYKFYHKAKLDKNFLDIPSDKLGYWRLSPQESNVYHMGNTFEEGLKLPGNTKVKKLEITNEKNFKSSWLRHIPYFYRHWLAFFVFRFCMKDIIMSLMIASCLLV